MADLLGGGNDDIDFDKAASAFPDISLDGMDDIPNIPGSAAGGAGFDIDSFEPTPIQRDITVTGDNDGVIEKFENEFPELEDTPALPPPVPLQQQPSFSSPQTFAPRPQNSTVSTPFLKQPIEDEEPEVIREWRERQAAEIAKRDEESKARRQDTIARAERALDQFYEEYSTKRKAQIAQNKDDEAAFLADLTESLAQGTTWDRICKLIELKDSQSKTLARAGPGTTELTRFREVLLRLRREGDSAPGAAGY
ncbi:clathrin light chain [Vararia minispora EC-137]|uniref:Clathrin light chain n=1 Tax=Vararia minispora EC-137 TaxID=1314806 RepID=A0ACB8QVG0_9AGAM|nr:clathrin light chain [Vararia minispora EC-137]